MKKAKISLRRTALFLLVITITLLFSQVEATPVSKMPPSFLWGINSYYNDRYYLYFGQNRSYRDVKDLMNLIWSHNYGKDAYEWGMISISRENSFDFEPEYELADIETSNVTYDFSRDGLNESSFYTVKAKQLNKRGGICKIGIYEHEDYIDSQEDVCPNYIDLYVKGKSVLTNYGGNLKTYKEIKEINKSAKDYNRIIVNNVEGFYELPMFEVWKECFLYNTLILLAIILALVSIVIIIMKSRLSKTKSKNI